MNKQRFDWVDYARGIVIVLVVLRHTLDGIHYAHLLPNGWLYELTIGFLKVFTMPLSFFLSGLFFLPSFVKRTPAGFVGDKWKVLMWPYLVWSLIQMGIAILLSGQTNAHLQWSDLLLIFYNPKIQLWFVYALFLMFLANAILYRFSKHAVFISLALSVGMYTLSDHPFGNTTLIRFFGCFIFFNLGALTQQFWLTRWELPRAWWMVAAFGIAFLGAQYAWLTGLADPTLLLRLALALLGIGFLVGLALHFPRFRIFGILKYLGQYSLPIYLAHILFTSGTRIILTKVYHTDNTLMIFLVGSAVGLVAPVLLYNLTANTRLAFLFQCPSFGWLRKMQPVLSRKTEVSQ